ncbi:hypothetical protein WJX73_010661 [Symbiochloris irregularis]|uniref:Uncharacterized protein n=1 Tax=Symbiochloris irregularis TaxID=706552 RepID=A0AAW1NIA9_9CHLO
MQSGQLPAALERLSAALSTGTSTTVAVGDPAVTLEVTPLEAHHCVGAVMFLLKTADHTVLHTGDFRWELWSQTELLHQQALAGVKVNELYLDNTYCHPKYDLPARALACRETISIIRQHLPDHHILIGVDLLGKEELLAAIAHNLEVQIAVSEDRLKTCHLMGLPSHLFTTNAEATTVRTISRRSAGLKTVARLNRMHPTLCVVPTGWQPAEKARQTEGADSAAGPQLQPQPKADTHKQV